MSGNLSHAPEFSRAQKLNAEAAAWLARANAGNWTAEDQAKLDAWLAQSRGNRVAYWRLEAAWLEAARLAALRPAEPPAEFRRHLPVMLMRIAAVVGIAAILSTLGANYVLTPRIKSYSTPVGGHETLKLSDGSRIELNTNTQVRLATVDGTRQVWLDRGEAYFQIKHDPAHPFVVIAGARQITDLGTKFLVRDDAKTIEVALLQGRVRFDNGNRSGPLNSVALKPGDVVMASAESVSVTKQPIKKLENELSWRQGLLVFNYTTLADAAAEFNRYNVKKIVVTDPEAARLTIIGEFPVNGVDLFGRVATRILCVRVEDRNNEIVISR
jgi:transmembrane sensor